MAGYSLSRKAAADLGGIYEYTILSFGPEQAQEYMLRLHRCFQTLAETPMFGRRAEELAPDLRRFEYQSHIVFYVPEREEGVLIVRVLHQSMDAARHLGQ